MLKKIFIIISVISICPVSWASARENNPSLTVDSRWRKKADTNADGKIDKAELSAWNTLKKERIDLNKDGIIDAKERRLYWKHGRSRVNTALEAKYDINSNGWLESNEAKQLLQDKYALIKTEGKAKVDTDVEAEYDSDGDGIIDAKEAKDLKEDLGI